MPGSVYRFGDFELDPGRFELRRNGRVQKLERIPMDLLILLVEKSGTVVTRQEIVERLWGKDVFLDAEHGINTAVRKVRQALRDDPDHPRFVRTVTGRGYLFVAAQNASSAPPEPLPIAQSHPAPESDPLPDDDPASTPEAAMRHPASRRGLIGISALVLLAIAGTIIAMNAGRIIDRLYPSHRASQIHSLAVLPLANLSGDASQDYFADGMTDELITALAKNRNLRVVSRTSAMQFKGAKMSLPEIARKLSVDGILEGSIERSANRVHMTVQLIYAPTDTHVWAESYDRDVNQAYTISEDLSSTVAREVKIATSPAPAPRYIHPEAHDAYLHGRYFWFTFNVANTLPYFQKAIQLQPDYGAAWSGLADTLALSAMTDKPASEVSGKSCDAAAKSVELDPLLADTHNSLAACYLFFHWDPVRAEAESRRAVELDPNHAEVRHLLSYVLEVEHRYPEGEAEAKLSTQLDPFIHPWELGTFYMGERKFDDAITELKLQITAHPLDPYIAGTLSKAYWLKGMYKESQEELERSFELDGDKTGKTEAHQAWLKGGEPAVERWGAERLKARARKEYVETEAVAATVAFTGDNDETIKYLEASYRERDPDLIFIQDEPLFDFLHSDPRYQTLVKKMGLPLHQ